MSSLGIDDYDDDNGNFIEKCDFHECESRVNNYRGKGSKGAKGKPKGKSEKRGSGERSIKGQKGFEKCKIGDQIEKSIKLWTTQINLSIFLESFPPSLALVSAMCGKASKIKLSHVQFKLTALP